MDGFICENTKILQDAAQFGLKAWIIPSILLLLGCSSLYMVRRVPNFAKTGLAPRPKFGAFLGVLAFASMGYLNLDDQREKRDALQSGDYATYQGRLTVIKSEAISGRGWFIWDSITLTIDGRIIRSDGKVIALDGKGYGSQVKTENAVVGYGGKSCFTRRCGLKVGDKVEIKAKRARKDTLRIEKCLDSE